MRALNKKEESCVDRLTEAWNEYIELPALHADDLREFRDCIHRLEEKVMSRPMQEKYNQQKEC